MRNLVAAVQFLTILRVSKQDAPPGQAAAWFPVIGAALGAAGAGVYFAASRVLPSSLAALAVVAFWTAVSGVLHEDGLADVADALRAGRTQERMLAILKDSRIGAFGAVAVALSLIARWQALDHLTAPPDLLTVCIASQAVPRAAMVALAWVSRPAGSGLASAFASTLSTPAALIAIALGFAAAMFCGFRAGVAMILGSYLIVRLARAYFYKRIGGVN